MLPGTQLALHPANSHFEGCCCMFILLALIQCSSKYLAFLQQQQAAQKQNALTPQSIIGDDVSWQRFWYTKGPNVPQGDASSLVVDRSMQQPKQASPQKYEDLFQHILSAKQRLYGSSIQTSIQGPHDLGTATAEINRYHPITANCL